ncbi:MAG: type II toxin-antitoxin system VapC family toxin [Pseudomonadales bacterium]|nr:type II toxin-antitoxin system VapC family toxin [Pseudomonadales bacterium]
MILVDTSVWIAHLNNGDNQLAWYLQQGQVLMHPFVLGELACGNLRQRQQLLTLLKQLPKCTCATDAEVLFFIERQHLMGKGIGYVDAHLLAAVALDGTSGLWTYDQRLTRAAEELGLATSPTRQGNLHESAPQQKGKNEMKGK